GERVLPLVDPHGLRVALVESASALERPFAPWDGSPVPVERQIRGLAGARLQVRALLPTTTMLGEALGYGLGRSEGEWHRWEVAGGGLGRWLDLRETPTLPRGAWGTGSIHHLAFRVADDAQQLEAREQVVRAGGWPTEVIDRFWFHSVYFKEPGGVLFELATDGPGFAVDEDPQHLGETLVLPPWLETHRQQIEAVLPPIALPTERADAGG
ncbi:MAG TPA: ring-cleaving dioxygenase, partial [Thermoanaerobaculia bacterium]|nr:ring-cleaving dioxygenase [Thermoanaerobaculia bacterium]